MRIKITLIIVLIFSIILGIIFWKNIYVHNKITNSINNFSEIPSRVPDNNCTWQPFQNKNLGISMLIENCIPQVYTFFAIGNNIEQKYVYYPSSTPEIDKTIQIFTKPINQTIQDAVKEQFIDGLPGSFSKTCIVVNDENVNDKKNINTELYIIEPNSARMALIDKEAGTDIPDYTECGNYAFDPDTNAYFEYQPNNSKTNFIFVNVGQDTPYFDPYSIKINN